MSKSGKRTKRSKKAHTPGPWKWNGMEAVHACNPHGSSDIVCLMGSDEADSVYARNEEEAEANIRLIEAAPDMLDALEILHTRLFAEQDGQEDSPWAAPLAMIHAAIAKAKGA